ncbi:MAG: FAD-dependent oxidoreductase [Acidimicrobiales bacterium]
MTDSDSGNMRDVVIVGGGLAGLTAAYRLASLGRSVTVYERRPLLGGKARSFVADSPSAQVPFNPWNENRDLSSLRPTVDKGYHIFPSWYWELWQLVDDIGAEENFFPRTRSTDVIPEAGSYALYMPPLEDLSFDASPGSEESPRSRAANVKTLIPEQKWRLWEWGPPISMLLTALGLASASGRVVEEMTVPDFVSTRWYNGQERASVLQDMIVKALANPSKHTSAYTMRQMFRRWIPTVRTGHAWTPCKGPLQHALIDPIVDACVDAGVRFQTDSLVSMSREGARLASLEFDSGTIVDSSADDVILAIPPDVLLDVIRAHPDMLGIRSLARLSHLRTAPMGAIDLYFVNPERESGYPDHLRVENFPNRHFSLIESEFGLTGFPISGVEGWDDHLTGAPGLVLQFVAGNVLDIHELPKEEFARLLIMEIAEYLDFDPERDLLACVAMPSSDEQLTMNDAGTWDRRPPADIKEVDNLFLAGDYVKLSVDVAGMEAAVESGSNAARAILVAESVRELQPQTSDDWDRLHEDVETAIPRPDGLPPWYWQDVIYPSLRLIFVTIRHVLGWLVTLAKVPFVTAHDFVGELHDRYEDHRDQERRDGLGLLRRSGWLPSRGRAPRGVPVNVPIHQRRKGLGTPVEGRDRLLSLFGWIAVVLGFGSTFLLGGALDDYSAIDDVVGVLGREAGTRTQVIIVAIIGWIGLQSFSAVVRKFMPGSQVLTWALAWFGVLWVITALFPLCEATGPGFDGTDCGGWNTGAGWAQGIHLAAAVAMMVLLTAMPFFTWWQVLRRLPQGYEVNWRHFRTFSGVMALAAAVSGVVFGVSLLPAVDWPAGLAERVHWFVGGAWLFTLGFWIMFRKHRAIDGNVAVPVGPLRSVDQRSLWA